MPFFYRKKGTDDLHYFFTYNLKSRKTNRCINKNKYTKHIYDSECYPNCGTAKILEIIKKNHINMYVKGLFLIIACSFMQSISTYWLPFRKNIKSR